MESQALVGYIEKIRYGRIISQEQMLEGVISIRQYRRYLYGKVDIPFGVFSQLANKINIPPRKLFSEFEEQRLKEKRLISSFYNAVVAHNERIIEKLYSQIDEDTIFDFEQLLFFESAKKLYAYNSGKINKEDVASFHKELIQYPKILANAFLTDNELYILGTISEYDPASRPTIMNKLQLLYESDQLRVSGDNVLIMTQILFWLAKYTGSLKQYDKTISYCDKAIEYNNQYQSKYLMKYFHYYKSLSYYRTNQIDEYKESLYKTILFSELEPVKNQTGRFYNTIKKDLNIEPLCFVQEYINQKLEK